MSNIQEEIVNITINEETIDCTTKEAIVYHITNYLEEDLEVPYNTQVEFVGEDVMYRGWAEPGTETTESSWRICRVVFINSTKFTVTVWANGNGEFSNVWDDRSTLDYS